MRVLGVIPARCGSKRIPHKNVRYVGADALVTLACNTMTDVDEWVISTDCPLVAAEAGEKGYGNHVFERECGPDGPMVYVLLEALRAYDDVGDVFDAVLCLQPTSPFRNLADVAGVIEMLRDDATALSTVSINMDTGQRNGAVYVTRVEMLRDGLVFDEHSLKYPMPAERSLDINTPEDLELARKIANEKGW